MPSGMSTCISKPVCGQERRAVRRDAAADGASSSWTAAATTAARSLACGRCAEAATTRVRVCEHARVTKEHVDSFSGIALGYELTNFVRVDRRQEMRIRVDLL